MPFHLNELFLLYKYKMSGLHGITLFFNSNVYTEPI